MKVWTGLIARHPVDCSATGTDVARERLGGRHIALQDVAPQIWQDGVYGCVYLRWAPIFGQLAMRGSRSYKWHNHRSIT